MSKINELVSQIRELINEPRKHLAISEDDTEWYRLCSSLDAIGDTELAFHEYEKLSVPIKSRAIYILVYGFLQALYLQQDAVRNLHKALQIPYKSDPLLREVREVRNAVVHPTDGGQSKEKRFRFISRMSLNKSGFQLVTVVPEMSLRKFIQVSLGSLLEKQHIQVENVLKALLEKLRKEEMDYRNQIRGESLESVFPDALGYYFEKICESARSGSSWEYGKAHIADICDILENFKSALDERQIAGAYSGIEYHLEHLKYPLRELARFFDEKGTGRLTEDDAEIFTVFVQNGMSQLQHMARGIDDEIAIDSRTDSA
ncbi:MAG: hypothetical protein OXH99_19690 [Bryobacterales bacterium]|nr:hypothetical protein [Bryobacterales bacterium]